MKKIKPIIQKHRHGCVIATIAMVTDRPYDEIEADFVNDFDEIGVDFKGTIEYLGDAGFSIVHSYITHYANKDFARELLLTPFAPRHILRIQPKFDSVYGHVVAMDGDGTIYCPEGIPDKEVRESYLITDVIGLFPLDYFKK